MKFFVSRVTANGRSIGQARALGKRNYSGAWPALRHSCGDTGRTAREQVRHFFVRLSATPVAPWAAYPHGTRCIGPLMPVTTCARSPALNRNQFGVLIGSDSLGIAAPCGQTSRSRTRSTAEIAALAE